MKITVSAKCISIFCVVFSNRSMDFGVSLEQRLRYKKDTVFTDAMADELFQCAQISAALDQRMNDLRKSVQLDQAAKQK